MSAAEKDDLGRCAEHSGLHEKTEDCRRFMALAFARDLGIKDPDDDA